MGSKDDLKKLGANEKKVLSALNNINTTSFDEIVKATKLSKERANKAIARLYDLGLVREQVSDKYDFNDFRGIDFNQRLLRVLITLLNEVHRLKVTVDHIKEDFSRKK